MNIMRSGVIKKLSDLPPILYKYYNFDSKGHLSLIRDSNIYFSSPAALNDPFEFPTGTLKVPDSIGQECKKSLLRMLDDPNFNFQSLDKYDLFASTNLQLKLLNLKYENINSETISCDDESILHDYIKTSVGVFSLSGNHNNILMWSHYAAEHSGLCVGLLTDRLLNIDADYIGAVKYQQELPKVENHHIGIETIMVSAAFHKSAEWRYEQEYRILKLEAKNGLVHIDRQAIHSVFIGCRAHWRAKALLDSRNSLLPKTKFYQAFMSGTHFGLDFQEL